MDNDFLRIAITPERIFSGEADRIIKLLTDGIVDLVHLRHPENTASEAEITDLLFSIPESLHPHVTLHDHFGLIEKFKIGGVHLNSRNSVVPDNLTPLNNSLRISKSCHSIAEIETAIRENGYRYSYVTLSPIFDSISKIGYPSAFTLDDLGKVLPQLNVKVIALGGVTPDSFHLLQEAHFSGAAMLGYYFPKQV